MEGEKTSEEKVRSLRQKEESEETRGKSNEAQGRRRRVRRHEGKVGSPRQKEEREIYRGKKGRKGLTSRPHWDGKGGC